MRVKRQLVLHKHSTIHTSAATLNQCKDVGHKAYNYEIEITCGEQLDTNGFIIDHSEIHHVIEGVINNQMGSCEELSIRAEEAVLHKMNQYGCELQRLVFSIKPVDSNAWIRVEAEYKREPRCIYPPQTPEEEFQENSYYNFTKV